MRAVLAGKTTVEQHHVVVLSGQRRQRGLVICVKVDRVGLVFQRVVDAVADHWVVIDQQYAHGFPLDQSSETTGRLGLP